MAEFLVFMECRLYPFTLTFAYLGFNWLILYILLSQIAAFIFTDFPLCSCKSFFSQAFANRVFRATNILSVSSAISCT